MGEVYLAKAAQPYIMESEAKRTQAGMISGRVLAASVGGTLQERSRAPKYPMLRSVFVDEAEHGNPQPVKWQCQRIKS